MFDFGFIDPPSLWQGNPNMDFRHGEKPRLLAEENRVESRGRALAVFADTGARSLTEGEVTDAMFERGSGE